MGRADFYQFCIFTEPSVPGDGRGKGNSEPFGDVLADKIGIVTDIGNIRFKTCKPALACDDCVQRGMWRHGDEFLGFEFLQLCVDPFCQAVLLMYDQYDLLLD